MGYFLCLIVGGLAGFIASMVKVRRDCRYCGMHEKFIELL